MLYEKIKKKNMKKSNIIKILFIMLLFPSICFADGGGPILLLINGYVFTLGQIWILFIEFIYLFYLLKTIISSKRKIFKITFIMNLLSTLMGAILFPLLLAIITAPGLSHMQTTWGGLLMACGTWIAGDHSPYPNVAMGATIVGFIITFFLTILIEKKYLKQVLLKEKVISQINILKHCIYFNLISYLGLVALFFAFQKY